MFCVVVSQRLEHTGRETVTIQMYEKYLLEQNIFERCGGIARIGLLNNLLNYMRIHMHYGILI